MQDVVDMVFDNQFFQLPFLEALSYVAAVLLVGAIIVGLTRRALGMVSPPSEPATSAVKRPGYEKDSWEWRKAA
jgi:hypothetical protein